MEHSTKEFGTNFYITQDEERLERHNSLTDNVCKALNLNDVEESIVRCTKTSVEDSEDNFSLPIEKVKSTIMNSIKKHNFRDIAGESDEHNLISPPKNFCQFCKKNFTTKLNLIIHMQSHDVGKSLTLTCSICDKAFYRLVDLQQHFRIHNKDATCYTFSMYSGLKCQIVTRNRKEGTVEKDYSCMQCAKSFASFQTLKNHLTLHTGLKDYACQYCDKQYNSSSTLKRHIISHTGKKPYVCDVCGKSFCEPYLLKNHQQSHKKKNTCEICKEDSRDAKSELNELVCKHQEHKLLRCDICSRFYTTLAYLKRHLRVVHGKRKSVSCEQCDMAFVTRRGYENHLQLHEEKSRFVCEVCNTGFARRLLLKRHLLVHIQSPYSCHICSKPFRLPDTLKGHMRTHSSEKPFRCQFCEKSFARRSSLNDHLFIHENVKPFECQFCQRKFRHFTTVKRHRRTCAKKSGRADRESDSLETDPIRASVGSTEDNFSENDVHDEDQNASDGFQGLGMVEPSQVKPLTRSHKKRAQARTASSNNSSSSAIQVPHSTRSTSNRKRLASQAESTGNQSDASFLAGSSDEQANLESVIPEPHKSCSEQHCQNDAESNPSACPDLTVLNANEDLRLSSTSSTGNQKPFICKVCGKAFTDRTYLTKHCYVHSATNPYKCPFCSQTFKHYNSSKRHRLKCLYSKSLSQKERQVQLAAVRQKKKRQKLLRYRITPVTCVFCYKMFANRDYLNRHMLIHDM